MESFICLAEWTEKGLLYSTAQTKQMCTFSFPQLTALRHNLDQQHLMCGCVCVGGGGGGGQGWEGGIDLYVYILAHNVDITKTKNCQEAY